MTIDWTDFEKVDIRAGKVVRAEDFAKARRQAYKLWIDFGAEIGEKRSSAQVTDLYRLEDLVGRTVLAVVNFRPKQIADFMSEVLVLGLYTDAGVVLIGPDREIAPGSKLG